MVGQLRKLIFGISLSEVTFAERGFQEWNASTRERLESIGRSFLRGYHAVLESEEYGRLLSLLNAVEPEFQGFAYEGAAMAQAVLDHVTPWKKNRLAGFLNGPGAAHVYMLHIGVGWAVARLKLSPESHFAYLDPLLRWLVVDGLGFHEGYFNPGFYIERRERPVGISGYATNAFDQGLGRSLWFVHCAEVGHIKATVDSFAPSRQADLWSGVGLACAYAGSADRQAILDLREASGFFLSYVAQGAVFAAKARQRAGNLSTQTNLACEILCGLSASSAAQVADLTITDLPPDGDLPQYEVWRGRIRRWVNEKHPL